MYQVANISGPAEAAEEWVCNLHFRPLLDQFLTYSEILFSVKSWSQLPDCQKVGVQLRTQFRQP